MNRYSLVLSDELLKLYFDFKSGNVNDTELLTKFLSYYHAPFITSIKQLKEIGFNDTSLIAQLANQGLISDELEELVQKTLYKIILNTEKSDYPYININGDSVEKNFSLTFICNQNRNKAHDLIKALCSDAKHILIYDSYIKNSWNRTKEFFNLLLPRKSLTIIYCNQQLDQDHISQLKKICNNWTIKSDTKHDFKNSHDRYLIIDNKIQIILSSGFDYLFDTSKDLSCLIREIK